MYSIKIITELIHQVAHTLMGCDRSLLLLLHQLKLRGEKKFTSFHQTQRARAFSKVHSKTSHCHILLCQTQKASASLRCQLLLLLGIHLVSLHMLKGPPKQRTTQLSPPVWRPLGRWAYDVGRGKGGGGALLSIATDQKLIWQKLHGFGSSFAGCGCSTFMTTYHYVLHRLRRDKDESRALALVSLYQNAFMWNICTHSLISLYVQTLLSAQSEYWPC